MTGQVLASQLVPPLASSARPEASTQANLGERLARQQGDFNAKLDALKPFDGLYATGQLDQSIDNSRGARYAFGLEWELYDQGRAESRRQLDRLRLENKAQYLQLLRDVEQRQLQENLLAVENMRNRLLATLYQREAAAIVPVLARRKQELANGRITRVELAEIEFKAERASLRARHYAGSVDVLVYPQAQELINRVEHIALKPEPELAELAATRSPDIQLQALLAESRSRFLPSVKDNTSVRLVLERNKEFERSPNNYAGVRVRIPIGDDKGRPELADATRALYADQQESLKATLRQKLALLADRLRMKQNEMRVLQAENKFIRAKADLACYRLDLPVSAIAADPDREVEEYTLRLHELQREILLARLDVLEVLTQVSALVKPREPAELYSLTATP